jgi:O-antigen biosynthesis protein
MDNHDKQREDKDHALKDYLIVSPGYAQNSAGIRALHYLCHFLNEEGLARASMSTALVNPGLNTPIFDRTSFKDEQTIVIYPEVVSGNPVGSSRVVRYVMNKPGYLGGGDTTYPDTDFVWVYSATFLPWAREATKQEIIPALHIPTIDPELFKDDGRERKGIVFYRGRKRGDISVPDWLEGATEITGVIPPSRQAVADLLKGAELFVSFVMSALGGEASLCGTPALMLDKPTLDLSGAEWGLNGIAYSREEVETARATAPLAHKDYLDYVSKFPMILQSFVELTQERFAQ